MSRFAHPSLPGTHSEVTDRPRWRSVVAPYLGVSMVVIDMTIVNVALPSIQVDLGLSANSVVWVVNGYLIPFGGSLLLCGRLGDYYGHRRIFALGVALFTLASLACGTTGTSALLLGARVIQGAAAAAIMAASLSSVAQQFDHASARAQAMAIYSLVCAGGSSAGVLLSGVVTSVLNWRWIFLVNLPVGMLTYALCLIAPLHQRQAHRARRLDLGGAVLITTSMMLAIFAILNAAKTTWWSTAPPLCGALVSFALFIGTELSVEVPIVPLSIFRHRNLAVSSIVYALWSSAQAIWLFIAALFLQLALGYDPMKAGLAFLPSTLITALFSLGISRNLVVRFGSKPPLSVGLLLVATGLILLTRASIGASYTIDVLPGMLLVGVGCGIGYNVLLVIAMNGVSEDDYGIASGILNGAGVMCSSIALAAVVRLVTGRDTHLVVSGAALPAVLNAGYHTAFGIGAMLAGGAWLVCTVFVRLK